MHPEFPLDSAWSDPDNQTILFNAFEHLFNKYATFEDD